VKVGGATLAECSTCGGSWVDGRTFEKIVAEKEEQALVLSAALPGFETKTAHPRAERYWPCPVCTKLMNRVNFAHISGVVLDACRVHGVWFDADELRQLVEFLRSGGLDKARKAERAEAPPVAFSLPSSDWGQEVRYSRFGDETHEFSDVVKGALDLLDFVIRRS
jgi:Zn-finger nucleic acid-binding protein